MKKNIDIKKKDFWVRCVKKQDHSISLFHYVFYIEHTTAVTCQSTSVAAARMLALCPVTVARLY